MEKYPPADVLKQAILDLTEPVILKNMINNELGQNNWNNLNLENLKTILGDTELPFRTGKNARTNEPQWDINCPTESMSLSEFMKKVNEREDEDRWYYFDYKYMHEWFKEKPEILSMVNWSAFGFEKTGEDSTLWIGSRGAHTNCHQDSYGCNLVAQIHGRKRWLLFPPDSGEVLRQTRVPYEESTIYSQFNFFCPSKGEEELLGRVDKVIAVVLEPGEVLFVPKGWWHFVESLDLSISVNVWLPLDSDCEARLREALVKLVMERIGSGLPAAEEPSYSSEEFMKLIEKCIKDCEKMKFNDSEPAEKRSKRSPWCSDDLVKEYPDVVGKLEYLRRDKFSSFLIEQRERFPEIEHSDSKVASTNDDSLQNVLKAVADAFCHPDVVAKIVGILINKK